MASKFVKTLYSLLPLILIFDSSTRKAAGSDPPESRSHCISEDFYDLAWCCDKVNDAKTNSQRNTEEMRSLEIELNEEESNIRENLANVSILISLELSDAQQMVPNNDLEGYVEKLKNTEEKVELLRLDSNKHKVTISQIEGKLDALAEELKNAEDLEEEFTQKMNESLAENRNHLMEQLHATKIKLRLLKESLNVLEKSISTMGKKMLKTNCDLQALVNIIDNLCLPPFTWQGDGCYYIPYLKKTWQEARSFCKDLGTDLVVPQNYLQFVNWLSSLTFDDDVWVGASDIDEEDRWTWVNGKPLNIKSSEFIRWKTPDQKEDEDCLEICSHAEYRPSDMKCDAENYFICQKSFSTEAVTSC